MRARPHTASGHGGGKVEPGKRARLTLEVPGQTRLDLDALVTAMTATTATEVIRRLVALGKAVYEAKRDGYTVTLTKPGARDKELLLP